MVRFYIGTTVPRMVKILKGSTRPNTYGSANVYDALFFGLDKAEIEKEAPALIIIDIPAAEVSNFAVPAHHEEFVRFIKPIDPKYIVSGTPLSRERAKERLKWWQNYGSHFQTRTTWP